MQRTARYFTAGTPGPALDEIWYVCHGYRQSAERFLGHFRSIHDSRRMLVAPEALSRFYIDPAEGRHGPGDRVGASWMTREDREAEIGDYIRYLDALEARIRPELESQAALVDPEASRPDPRGACSRMRSVVLGFSQGVHTAARWVALGQCRPDHLVLWGACLPADLEKEEAAPRLRALTLTLVRGTRDPTADAGLQTREEERLEEWDIPFRVVTFEGGHRIDDRGLAKVAEIVASRRSPER